MASGPPAIGARPLTVSFLVGTVPLKNRQNKLSSLILTSLLEDLVGRPEKWVGVHTSVA